MSEPPKTKWVHCPACNADAVAVIPRNSAVVDREAEADGKVRVGCHECGNEFRVHFALDT